MLARMIDSPGPERFHVRLEGHHPVRLTVAEMTPEDARLAVRVSGARAGIMMENTVPALALLQRVADGDRSMTRRQLRKARETVATLVRVQQQTSRLHAAVRTVLPAAAN
jgi:hypothetical protein